MSYAEFEAKYPDRRKFGVNVGRLERIASTIGGGALIGYAIASRSKASIFLGLLGAASFFRGATGNCQAYRILGINTADNAADEIARRWRYSSIE